MLIPSTKPIEDFIKFVNSKKICEVPCKVVLLPDYDSIRNGDEMGFAAYDPFSKVMYVAGDLSGFKDLTPEEQIKEILLSVTHEYIHHVQNAENKDFDEEEAQRLAEEFVKEYCQKDKAKKQIPETAVKK